MMLYCVNFTVLYAGLMIICGATGQELWGGVFGLASCIFACGCFICNHIDKAVKNNEEDK